MKPLYIFDLDGTLALCDHRRLILENKGNPNRWDDFYRACVRDEPNKSIIELYQMLYWGMNFSTGQQNEVRIFSGRSELVRDDTIRWLWRQLGFLDATSIWIKMRPIGDYTPDEQLKKKWYDELSQKDKNRLVCVFDDRQKIVDMWRSIGVTCLQVAPGNF